MYEFLYIIDLIGVAVFAISGTLMAQRKNMDGVGVIVLASVTGIGGGTIRDMILDQKVFWVNDTTYLTVIICAAILTILWIRNERRKISERWLLLADAIGLSFFVVLGAEKALNLGESAYIAVVMGTMTGCFGGMIRDALCQETPLIFRGQLYAIPCIFGALVYTQAIAQNQPDMIAIVCGVLSTLIFRISAIYWDITIPVFKNIDKS
ncbi:trimeric intracellular cation channel family protein [Algicola sagamiensis]|uniref:trimeric intracellular cation channel family protein n=1 Tax=Algicola sagamiensis TaxID=163869 RepID=UPI0003829C9C|nr:trimeric intracellular cation channel family protein [Algicola sagamiensis]